MSYDANLCEVRPEPQDAFDEAQYQAWVESHEPRCIDETHEDDADLLDPTGGYEYDPNDLPDFDYDESRTIWGTSLYDATLDQRD